MKHFFKNIRMGFFAILVLLTSSSFADVYPFEEEYGEVSQKEVVSEKAPFKIQQSEVTPEERETIQSTLQTESRKDRYLSYRSITYKNAGQIFLNLAAGIGAMYKDLFTEGLPEYGADLASIPAGSAELTGKFLEIERKELFERDAKEKDIQAYVQAQQKPLTPEEQKLLEELRSK